LLIGSLAYANGRNIGGCSDKRAALLQRYELRGRYDNY
jgi:hypothetical protein